MYRLATKHTEKRNRRNYFKVWFGSGSQNARKWQSAPA